MKIIAGIGPDEIIKVLNFLKSSQELGINFEYPWLNDKKKLKFTMTGLKLAKYLVTVLGSNIKTVTWMGDNVNYDLAFQGGSHDYLEEDINELEGDYDSMNSAVNIIEKLGPLDADAPYVVEFKKAPEQQDWANFMISLQGIGDSITINDLYGLSSGENGTIIDSTNSNTYTNTSVMEPAYNTSTFIPSGPAFGCYGKTYSLGPSIVRVNGLTIKATPTSVNNHAGDNTVVTVEHAPAGYYLAVITDAIFAPTNITQAITYTGADRDIIDKYKLVSYIHDVNTFVSAGNYIAEAVIYYAFHLASSVNSPTFLLQHDNTGTSGVTRILAHASLVPITASDYEDIEATAF